jgi:hypothetical protein
MKLLVESYRKLRQSDKVGINSYRITVRQLESMVRLSEALAKLYCETFVTPKHVKEALKLLRVSISKVDKEPIKINENEKYWEDRRKLNQKNSTKLISNELVNRLKSKEDSLRKIKELREDLIIEKEKLEIKIQNLLENNEDDNENMENRILEINIKIDQYNKNEDEINFEILNLKDQLNSAKIEIVNEVVEEEVVKKVKKEKIQVSITFEKYKNVSDKVVYCLRKSEEINNFTGLMKKDIIDWYIKNYENGLDENELINEIKLIEKIINRLINQDNILIDTDYGNNDKDDMEHILIVHPNYFTE